MSDYIKALGVETVEQIQRDTHKTTISKNKPSIPQSRKDRDNNI